MLPSSSWLVMFFLCFSIFASNCHAVSSSSPPPPDQPPSHDTSQLASPPSSSQIHAPPPPPVSRSYPPPPDPYDWFSPPPPHRPPPPPPPHFPCSGFKTCGPCNAMYGCTWCEGSCHDDSFECPFEICFVWTPQSSGDNLLSRTHWFLIAAGCILAIGIVSAICRIWLRVRQRRLMMTGANAPLLVNVTHVNHGTDSEAVPAGLAAVAPQQGIVFPPDQSSPYAPQPTMPWSPYQSPPVASTTAHHSSPASHASHHTAHNHTHHHAPAPPVPFSPPVHHATMVQPTPPPPPGFA